MNSMQNRSSRRIKGIALAIMSRKVSGDKPWPAPNVRADLTSYYLVTEAFGLKILVGAPEGKPLLPCGELRSIDPLNISSTFSTRSFFNFYSSDEQTAQDSTKKCRSMDLCEDGVSVVEENISRALIKPNCPFQLAAFILRTVSPVGQ